jgi:hypothetical protein
MVSVTTFALATDSITAVRLHRSDFIESAARGVRPHSRYVRGKSAFITATFTTLQSCRLDRSHVHFQPDFL